MSNCNTIEQNIKSNINTKKTTCVNYKNKLIFQTAINHCRAKTICRSKVKNIPSVSHFKNKSFQQIFCEVWNYIYTPNKIGSLIVYDCTVDICERLGINIDHIFLVGKGPQKAIKIIKKMCKDKKIKSPTLNKYNIFENISSKNTLLTLVTISIQECKRVFEELQINIPTEIKESTNGDHFETWLCNWQKTITA